TDAPTWLELDAPTLKLPARAIQWLGVGCKSTGRSPIQKLDGGAILQAAPLGRLLSDLIRR
ncbi:MAG: hypothetical protein R8K20_07215, partial [Gallionellaceae bacterium]